MARWDEILSLPVQSPPTLEFSSADIVWSKVEGWRDAIDRVALIPFDRVNDFVRGESANKDCPTRFHVEARRRRPPALSYKPKVDGILEYILYWCSFGPDDHRKGGVIRPSRVYSYKRKTPAGRPNTKRGCVCHFIVKRLIAEPTVALIIYNQDKHVDKKGQPCHGPLDKKAVGTNAMFAPYISDELRLRVLSLLHVGVPVETIMQRHNESVEKQGGPCNRDDLLTHRYVRRLERSIRRSTHELDPDDAVSISMWVESHRNHIFFYEDFSDSEPFVLGIQTEWQLQQMIRFGNRGLVASDSRFGSSKLKYPVHSLLVFNSNNKAIPVAWIITPQFASSDADRWVRALYNRIHSKDPTWKLAGFIVDDPFTDIRSIREVFQCSVLISFWRVRHAWHKNLIEKCSDTKTCVEIMKRIGQAIYSICKGNGNLDLFEDFMEDFVDCLDFMDYFKAIWFPRMGMWTMALKTLPLASQETGSTIESYHHQFKMRLLNEKDTSVYQRVDWLVDKLGTKVHSYYWLDEYLGKDDFARYQKDEWQNGLASWRLAMQIPDSDVVLEDGCAKVTRQHNRENAHIVWNPGSEFALCDCNWSRFGNLCKHVIKVSQFCRSRGLAAPSVSLFAYNRMLRSMLHFPPHDSLIRDHAVTLAVCAQAQLNTIFDLENKNFSSASNPKEQLTSNGNVPATEISEDTDEVLLDGSQSIIGDFPSHINHSEIQNAVEDNVKDVMGDSNEAADFGIADDLGSAKETDTFANNGCGNASTETVSGRVKDIDSLSTSCSGSVEQQLANNVSEFGQKYLSNESNGISASTNHNTVSMDNGVRDHIASQACADEVTEHIGYENGISGDIGEAVTDNTIDVVRHSVTDGPSSSGPVDQGIVDIASEGVVSEDVPPETVIGDMMDLDPHQTQSSLTRLESSEQQTKFDIAPTDNGVCSDVAEPSIIGDMMEVDLPSMAVSNDQQTIINLIDRSGVVEQQ